MTGAHDSSIGDIYTYTEILDPEINKACRAITGCHNSTSVKEMLAVISPPDIRRDVCTKIEGTSQMAQETKSLIGHIPARSRLKSGKGFMTKVVLCTSGGIGQVALRHGSPE